jgi:hypothetical protein
MDFSASQIEKLKLALVGNPLAEYVTPIVHDVRKPWPVSDACADLLVDAFCFKHQIERTAISSYVEQASRCVRPGGLCMISFAGRGDGYYSQFPILSESDPGQVIIDPANRIASRLYEPNELIRLFEGFEAVETLAKRSRNVMHEKVYSRETYVVYLRRV